MHNVVVCAMAFSIAGVLVTAVTNPLWVVKTRMQLDSRNTIVQRYLRKAGSRPSGLLTAIRHIHRREGVRGFYRGLAPALLLCSHGAVQMMVYEEVKQWRAGHLAQRGVAQAPPMDAATIGAGAKLVASACTYPLQVARSRMQQQLHGSKVQAYASLPRALVSVVKTSGLRGLYQGFTANVLRVCPQAGIQFFLYEQARRMLG
jgi:solute carrier family 25 (mitochondrial folate transporter), member 32